jgi:hypothetical protein
MPTRQLYQLCEILRSMVKSGSTYHNAARVCGVVDARGKPDRAMAYRIIHGYEPIRPATRKRLGLPIIFPFCKRPMQIKKRSHHSLKSLLDYPDKVLKRMFENRVEIK